MNRYSTYLFPIPLLLWSLTLSVPAHDIGADFDGDGRVGFADFLLFAGAFESTQDRFDLTHDGRVDFQDFLILAADYGKVTHEEGTTETGPAISSFEMLQRYIFNESCISSSCHSTAGAAGGLSLEPGDAYRNLVNQEPQNLEAQETGMRRVLPGNAEGSLLLKKLTGSGAGLGDRMPRGFSSLTGAQIDAVRTWIVGGAPREGVVSGVPDLSRLLRDARHHFEPPPPPDRGIQLHLKPFAVAPGKEREIFSTTTLGVTEDLLVNRIEIAQPEGSHHFILYRLGSDTAPPPGLRDLDPTDPGQAIGIFRRQLIIGSQSPDATFQFPEGVAISMPAGAAYELNSHFVNTTGINTLSPGKTVTSTTDWTLPEDIYVVLLSSHMHRHGKRFDIFLGGKRIYRNLHWDDPENLLFNPPLEVKTGEKVRFECTHENDDKDFPLRFGFTAENDEMCILLGYYYSGEK